MLTGSDQAGMWNRALLALIAVCLAVRLWLVFTYEVNWDEFLNLSMVYDYKRRDMTDALQTMFVHGFGWVSAVSANEVDQVVAARVMIYILGLGTAAFIYLISRHFMPAPAALFAVFCYVSFSFVIRQGNSLRTDTIATFLMMAALWIATCRPTTLFRALSGGLLVGTAGMITIKSIFYVPTLAIILLVRIWSAENRRRGWSYAVMFAAASLCGFGLLYLLHQSTLQDPASSLAFLDRTTGKTLVERDFGPAKGTFVKALVENPVFWLMTGLGLTACLSGPWRTSEDRDRRVMLASFAIILGTLFTYTESHAYYYVFMLAPVAVLCGFAFPFLVQRTGPLVPVAVCTALAIGAAGHSFRAAGKSNEGQRQTLAAIHRMFPYPVPYIDRCSMVSSYPKRGLFMSMWGMRDYYRAGKAVMRPILEKDQPRFLVANREMLDLDRLKPGEDGPSRFGLFKEDIDVLKSNYIRHWGAIYVAGKRLGLSVSRPDRAFEILIAGPYTVEGPGPVLIDGRTVRPGSIVELDRGWHRLQQASATGMFTLRWGKSLYRPAARAPESPLFNDF